MVSEIVLMEMKLPVFGEQQHGTDGLGHDENAFRRSIVQPNFEGAVVRPRRLINK